MSDARPPATPPESADEARRRLEVERDFLRAILESTAALVVVLDSAGRILRFNPACEKLTGFTFLEVIGRPMAEVFLSAAASAACGKLLAGLPAGQSTAECQFDWTTREGERRPVLWTFTALANADGEVEYIVGNGLDITQRKQMEESIRQLSGLIPMCASCKKMRDDDGYWYQVEEYIRLHTEADFTHGICPECIKKLYPEFQKHQARKSAKVSSGENLEQKAWVVSVDMGYGHQRAAYPFQEIAWERIITANNDPMISEDEKKYWASARDFYESLSRMRESNFIGRYLFNLYDRLQAIAPFFPMRDQSHPSRVVRYLRRRIDGGLCRSLVEHLRQKPLPILTTHFIPALAAEYLGLENIYCVVTDTDINRVWVPVDPRSTRITYLAPSRHALTRLKTYGIPESRIHLTGFPLPHELVGGRDGETIKADLGRRFPQLDPQRKFRNNYEPLLRARLGDENYHEQPLRPLTIAYMVGGAGAQRGIGIQIVQGLRDKIAAGQVKIILVAGVRDEVAAFFRAELERIGVTRGAEVICHPNKFEYFRQVNLALRETDLIWTKPSELIFYTALGLPVIMSPPVGAHEGINQRWLENIGSGFPQQDLQYVEQWLFYILESGKFAEAAWDGYINATAMGAYRIEDALFNGGPAHPRQAQRDQ